MATFKAKFSESSGLNARFSESSTLNAGFSDVIVVAGGNLLIATTAEWNAQVGLIAAKDTVYVYTDHMVNSQGQPIPGFKAGDGTSYLIDLPFDSDGSSGSVKVSTSAEWNAQADLISEEGTIYVYSDYWTTSGDVPVPGFKVGDGSAYLIDLPFTDQRYVEHVSNDEIHITNAERTFWNNKVTAYLADSEELVLSKL